MNQILQNSTHKFVQPAVNDLKQLRIAAEEQQEDSKAYKNFKRNRKILRKFAEQFINWPQFNGTQDISHFGESFIYSELFLL